MRTGAVGGKEGAIEDAFDDEWRDDGNRRGEDDERARRGDSPPVWGEELADAPPQVGDRGRLGVERLLRLYVESGNASARAAATAVHRHVPSLCRAADVAARRVREPRGVGIDAADSEDPLR